MHHVPVNQAKSLSNAMAKSHKPTTPDAVIFGAGIAGLWTFHRLKKLGFDVLLLEKNTIGCGQTIASQGIIHSGLKFSLAGKVNALAKSISAMPDLWRDALNGQGDVDLSAASMNAPSQQLLIPRGLFGNLGKLAAQKALGKTVHDIPRQEWGADIKNSGFDGSVVFMGEPILNIPTVIRALAAPYKDCIKTLTDEQAGNPIEYLKEHNISPKCTIFTSAQSNAVIAAHNNHAKGLETQARPLLQGMLKPAPFPLFAHLVGKTDKPLISITTHKAEDGTLVWYLGGRVAERTKESNPQDVYKDALKAFQSHLPNVDFSNVQWAVLPIDRIEGKSKTDGWMPDTPTIHRAENTLYCWPTKLTFAPLLSDMILKELAAQHIEPSHTSSDFSFMQDADYAKTPWDTAKWTTLN